MPNIALTLAVALIALLQTGISGPHRLGFTAHHLTDDDIAQISAAASARPWVLVARPPGFDKQDRRWYVEVYLEPDRISPLLRRGSIETFIAELPGHGVYTGPRNWIRSTSMEYAQVPVTGTDARVVVSRRDLNRPFRLLGSFRDEELSSLVAFVRASPTGPEAHRTSPYFRGIKGDWPISGIARRAGDVVEVSLLDEEPHEKSGQRAQVRLIGGVWTIERLAVWVLD